MGMPSLTLPSHRTHNPLRIVFLFLFLLSPFKQSTSQALPLVLPSAIVYDSIGNLYIADTADHLIRKLDTTGTLTTVAGTGIQGFSGDNGLATAAQLDSPQGLALDANNNLYIADTHNHRIRKLYLNTGQITTIAGTGIQGFSGDNGSATTAHLNLPTALALDTANNLYIADSANHRIRKLNLSTGQITTIAGNGTQGFSGDNGPAITASIDSPTGLALDTANNLYLADTHNHRIRRIDSSTGLITTIAGTGTQGFSGETAQATNATLALPHGLTIDASGNLYVADTSNHRIRRIDSSTGLITTVAGTGTQGFSGDNGPAIAATLDSPHATNLSSTNLVTFADTSNQRIRQLTDQPAPTTTIQTIAGIGLVAPETLQLSNPGLITYGTGTITATLSTSATGPITFLDQVNANTSSLGATTLINNTATLDTSTLPAGTHTITATYPGDQTHASAQSLPIILIVNPQSLTADPNSITNLYGQSIPTITGTLIGLLPQDASNLTATFSSTAAPLSPVGIYPLTAAISGPAAVNYALTIRPANLTINPASTQTTLANTTSGVPLSLTSHVASTTTGNPTGTVTLLDSANPLLTSPISSTGDAAFTITTLPQGTHTLTAVYSGSTNFSSSTSASTLITIGTPTAPDFTLTPTGALTQSIVSGSSATYTFTVQTQGNLASPIALTATGLPHFATASFNPAYLPPGSTGTFTLTVATPSATALQHHRTPSSRFWALLLFPAAGLTLRRPNLHGISKLFSLIILSLPLILCAGCGDRVNNGSASTTTSTQTYAITVTGTATTASSTILQHTATVSLNLIAAN
jgi:sugar lactone lactonase YvrE